jgi:phage terminase small subunit
LAEEADADIGDIIDESGALKPIKQWPKIFRQGLVAGIDVSQIKTEDGGTMGEVVKIKLADRNAKLKMIGDHIGVGAFKQQLQLSGEVDLNLAIEVTFGDDEDKG